MSRRFVNMMVHRHIGHRTAFSLHRINPWRCFYPSAQEALAANRTTVMEPMEEARLPRAGISFYKPSPPIDLGEISFISLGRDSNDIISMDQDDNTLLYGAASRAVRLMPVPQEPKSEPISLAVGDSLYLLNTCPCQEYDLRFEALVYPGPSRLEDRWYWRPLSPPPFAFGCHPRPEGVGEGDYRDDGKSRWSDLFVQSYTVVGDSKIWISTGGCGTFSFDTTTGAWSKTGEWALPFHGRVEYAPELGLWFGFSSGGRQFAASDLGAASAATPPVLKKAWDELAPPLPKQWVPVQSHLQPLGCGKFCIVRTFLRAEEGWCRKTDGNLFDNLETFAVFTGVEVERGSGGAIRMIRHRSRRYSFAQSMAVQPL